MEHDLVIGGSGMLSGLVETMARGGRCVSVVARGAARLERLAARHPNIHPLVLDYYNETAFDAGLAAAAERHGPFSRCVAWMHDDSTARTVRIARQVRDVHCAVLSSASADPAKPERLTEWRTLFPPPPTLRLAVLGFMVERGVSRWLTDAEISTGVGRTLESEDAVTIVGTVTPWSARP
jgi:NAD(P)-dependent dehydrogenase (short-subunit alcohol dehydrogenase family)